MRNDVSGKLTKGPQRSPRSGVAIITAIVVMIISTSICLVAFRTISLRHRHVENRIWKIQSQLIADAALERFAEQLAQQEQPDDSVTWSFQVHEEVGEAEVVVDKAKPGILSVKVISKFPVSEPTRAQTTVDAVLHHSD